MSYYVNFLEGLSSNEFHTIIEPVLELLAKQSIQPIYQEVGQNGLNWQCCLAGSSKTAPRILIFSIVLGSEYSFYVKSIATHALPKVDIIICS